MTPKRCLEDSIESPVRAQSRLEPYRDVILRWHREGHSFRCIHAALAKNGIHVALMTLHEFVKRRARPRTAAVAVAVAAAAPALEPDQTYRKPVEKDIHARPRFTPEERQAMRDRARASNHKPSVAAEPPLLFDYDPSKPLQNKPTKE